MNTRSKLSDIAKSNGWDEITDVGTFRGTPVYRLRNSSTPRHARTGYPHLFSTDKQGRIFELDTDQIHEFLSSLK